MPKIEIVEYDLTSPGRNPESTDVAYIPGFVDVANNFDASDYDNVLPINVPTLFTDVTSFEAKCGKQPAKFATTQYYKDIGGMNEGFDEVAVPYNGIMFAKGDVDPAYVMAKELLSMGLNVLYERVNPDVDSETPSYIYITADTEPTNWASIKNICDKKATAYEDLLSARMPEMTTVANGTAYSQDKTYYVRLIIDGIVYYQKAQIGTATEGKIPAEDIDEEGIIKSKSSATNIYYLKDTDTKYFIKKPVASETVYTANKYYRQSETLGYEIIANESQPDNWPVGAYEFAPQQLEAKQVEIEGKNVNVETFTSDWIEGWANNGILQTIAWVPNDGVAFVAKTEYRILKSDINIKTMYNALNAIFDAGSDTGLMDRGNYSFKYMTTGGYPVYEYNQGALVQKMLNVAANRGDCVAIIDHTDNINRDNNIDHSDSLYATVKDDTSWKAHGEFATMFTPWATYNRLTTDKDYLTNQIVTASDQIRMPASFAYLLALADSIKTNANWLAIAGSARGAVLHLADDGMTTVIPNGAADKMQPRNSIAINPITNINPYGNIIWGNRTLKDNADKGNLTATSFLNIRNLVSDVKKQCYRTARQLTFEQNNDILWINFKALMSPLLDTMLSGYGISGYKMVIDTDKMRELGYPKATLCVKIILFPVYAVEDFYISIVLKDDDISVVEA